MFRLLNCEPQIWLRAMRMSKNELVEKSHKGSFCCKPLYETSDLKIRQQSINSIFFPGHDLISGQEVSL